MEIYFFLLEIDVLSRVNCIELPASKKDVITSFLTVISEPNLGKEHWQCLSWLCLCSSVRLCSRGLGKYIFTSEVDAMPLCVCKKQLFLKIAN